MLYSNYWKIEKCKEYNSPENQYTVRILAGMKTEDFADQQSSHSLNRGGLYAVMPEGQELAISQSRGTF